MVRSAGERFLGERECGGRKTMTQESRVFSLTIRYANAEPAEICIYMEPARCAVRSLIGRQFSTDAYVTYNNTDKLFMNDSMLFM